jgi:general secretion pathway protein B
MSYILDALTKAAQQRERQVPVVQRLLSAAPAQRASWTLVPRRLPAALAVGAGLLAVALVWWLRSTPSPTPREPTPALSASAPRTPSVETARPVRVEPSPRPEIPATKPAPIERAASAVTPAVTAMPQAPASPSPETRPPAAVVQPMPAPARAMVAPATTPAPAPPTPAERAALKLEALIYSDVPAQRMVFINGRRYAEGDTVDGRLRVEEIQEDGVALSDQGRRFTLRVAR